MSKLKFDVKIGGNAKCQSVMADSRRLEIIAQTARRGYFRSIDGAVDFSSVLFHANKICSTNVFTKVIIYCAVSGVTCFFFLFNRMVILFCYIIFFCLTPILTFRIFKNSAALLSKSGDSRVPNLLVSIVSRHP